VQAIKEVCKEYNILVYDLFNESGINESNLKSYTIDNLNLNSTGYIRISTLISNYLKTVK
jgi:lysophospholipase L1-like esterase